MAKKQPTDIKAKEMAAALYIAGKSVREISRRLNVPRATLHDWIHRDPAFISDIRAPGCQLSRDINREIRAYVLKCVKVANKGDPTPFEARRTLERVAAIVLKEAMPTDDPTAIKKEIERDGESGFYKEYGF